jgi:FkbM family methyltransferase
MHISLRDKATTNLSLIFDQFGIDVLRVRTHAPAPGYGSPAGEVGRIRDTYSPALFRMVNRLVRANIRGSSRLMNILTAWGVLNVVAEYPLGTFVFGVPLWRNAMDLRDLLQYESALINLFCSRIASMKDGVLFDCGADIGIVSSAICARSKAISSVIALEPNEDALPHLERNMAALPLPARAVGCAVANFVGAGKLESPGYDRDHTARFLVPGGGPIRVTTIDSFRNFRRNVAIKIDVEGGEISVLRGARETIRSAGACVIAIEAHPLVANRTGQDPVECLRFLESIRPFEFSVAETGANLTTSRPILKPGQTQVHNIVCATV